jgi:lipopolysaccharide biosynthesis glycosyltransferase
MYYYLLLPKVLNTNEVSKIIYLDIDAFVISDITELYKMRNTSVFAGVKEAVIIS